ncbi:GIY-YIG nuclease family protein [Paenarthrobacter sp. YIM B13468]|uniref:GIY-YIG nuclease family protein n=1 Tax=Paenarthrobacter sp. YIM B13468 TaxID=3366295 RepID=UPI00366FA585
MDDTMSSADHTGEPEDGAGATPNDNGTPAYKHAGVPLTPTVIAYLAPALMAKPTFKRSQLAAVVKDFHVSQGGLPSGTDLITQVKKALTMLKKAGKLESASPGHYRWLGVTQLPGIAGEIAPDEPSHGEDLSFDDVIVEGEGQGSVYVYYFPAYKELAELRGNINWPCKVGMTAAGNARIRIADQQGTAMPEKPVLAYLRRTDTPRKLETNIQSILFFRNQQLGDAPGEEWFWTNPEEIRSIANWVHEPPRPG